jgi:hypothetical protein
MRMKTGGLVLLLGLAACAGRREEAAEETSRVATDTIVETRQVVDTMVVRTDTTIAVDTTVVADTVVAADTTRIGGEGVISADTTNP